MVKKPHDGAQHQHYVPKFILRNFLSLAPRERDREQVRVFDKVRRAPISNPVSIDNIMGERRFHDFQVDDAWVSAEEAIGDIEHGVLPAYRSLVDERRFSNSIEERAAVSMLLALQFLRTREMRDRFQDLDDKLEAHIRRLGGTMDMLEGWEPQDENARKIRHVDFLARTIREFATIISKKHFLLFEPPPGRSFYLSDNPVNLHNSSPKLPAYGGLGLAVTGIEIYFPLASNLMLGAWCPSLLGPVLEQSEAISQHARITLLKRVQAGEISFAQMKQILESISKVGRPAAEIIDAATEGLPLASSVDNMDFFNSLQLSQSRRFIICQRNDFSLAKRWVTDFPDSIRGRSFAPN